MEQRSWGRARNSGQQTMVLAVSDGLTVGKVHCKFGVAVASHETVGNLERIQGLVSPDCLTD